MLYAEICPKVRRHNALYAEISPKVSAIMPSNLGTYFGITWTTQYYCYY